jgi:hypothetical protein
VTGLGATQVKLHLHRLVELEYVLVHRAPRGHGVSYELLLESAVPPAEVDHLQTILGYDPERSDFPVSGRPPVGGRSGGGRTARIAANPPSPHHFTPAWSEPSGHHGNGRPSSPVR